jgi:hypothetical protein
MHSPPSPTFARLLSAIAAIVVLGITGCSREETPALQRTPPVKKAAAPAATVRAEPAIEAPTVDKTRAAEWMQAIFGDDYRAEDDTALVEIEDGEDAGFWRMTLRAARELPDGRIAVVVNGAPSDENGTDMAGHVSPGMLSVFTLRRTEGAWQTVKRYLNVTTMGSSGNIGFVKWIALGPGRPGIIVSSGGTWFGSTMADAEIYDLDGDMRSLGGFPELSTNGGGCMPETKDCWDVGGKIGTVPAAAGQEYRDIVVDFQGKHFRVTEDTKGDLIEHPTRAVRESARYRFNGKQYMLVSGKNPVPGIEG